MNLKSRVKSYSFWVSLSSAIFLLLKLLGQQFGFYVDENLFSDLFTTLCGIMVILGIIVPPASSTNNISNKKEINLEKNLLNLNTSATKEKYEANIIDCNYNINDNISNPKVEDINNEIENTTYNSELNFELDTNEDSQNLENQTQDTNDNLENSLTNNNENFDDFEKIKLSLINLLKTEENKFSGNYTEFKRILQNQINMLQDKE